MTMVTVVHQQLQPMVEWNQ